MAQVLLRDIAEKLDLSISTVSKALNDYPEVNKKTRKMVKEMAAMLNYRPNNFAVNLRTKTSKTIGVIIPEVVHHFFSSVLEGVIAEAEKRGYLVIILQSSESYELEKRQLQLLMDKQVDGILISLANATADFSHITEILSAGKPLVMFDKIAKNVHCSKVIIDDRAAAYEATAHLIRIGCRKIAHFRGPLLPQNSIDRFLGYKKALLDHGMEYDPELVLICEHMSFEDGEENTRKLLKNHGDIDGLFINTDLVAIGAMSELKNQGYRIPEDVSIVGFSNYYMSVVVSPPLTTIDQPGYQMGRKSFKMLYKEIKTKRKDKPIAYRTVTLDTELLVRGSTKNAMEAVPNNSPR